MTSESAGGGTATYARHISSAISAVVVLALPAAAGPPVVGETKVIVHRSVLSEAETNALAADLPASGGRQVARRPAYDVYSVPDGSLAALKDRPGLEPRPDFDLVSFGEMRFDAKKDGADPSQVSAGQLGIVQFSAPPSREDRELLTSQGHRILEYLPQNAYLVWLGPEGGAAILGAVSDSASPIQFFRPVPAGDKVSRRVGELIAVRQADATGGEPIGVDVLIANVPDVPAGEVGLISEYIETRPVTTVLSGGRYTLLACYVTSPEELEWIASLDTVVHIEPHGVPGLTGESSSMIVANQTNDPVLSGGNTITEIPNPVPSGAEQGYIQWIRTKLATGGGNDSPAKYPIVTVFDNGVDLGLNGAGGNSDLTAVQSHDLRKGGSESANGRLSFSFRYDQTTPSAPIKEDQDQADTANVPNHGHLVASLVAGYNTRVGDQGGGLILPLEDEFNFNHGMGVNPFGRVGNAKFPFAPFTFPDQDPAQAGFARTVREYWGRTRLSNLDETANQVRFDGRYRAHPGVISSNSWAILTPGEQTVGDGIPYLYNAWSAKADELIRDADDTVPGNQPLTFVVAAGNWGWQGSPTNPTPRYNSVTNPGLAKNAVTVGGSEDVVGLPVPNYNPTCDPPINCDPAGPPTCDPVVCDYDQRDGHRANNIWAHPLAGLPYAGSSLGNNTAGARIKPDLVAPAIAVRGELHGFAETVQPCDRCFFGQSDHTTPDQLYTFNLGTSMATPHVAGAAQICARFLESKYGIKNPSPALLKAYLIHTSKFLRGEHTGPTQGTYSNIPSPFQGFGRVNLDFGLKGDVPRFILDQSVILDQENYQYTIRGRKAVAGQPIRAVLAWTDPAGQPGTGNLVNDLYLEMNSGRNFATRTTGNNFAEDATPLGVVGLSDTANNVEAIYLPNPTTVSSMVFTVGSLSITKDALDLPAGTTSPRQDFALVIYNFIPEKNFGQASDDQFFRLEYLNDDAFCLPPPIVCFEMNSFEDFVFTSPLPGWPTGALSHAPAISPVQGSQSEITLSPGADQLQTGSWGRTARSSPIGRVRPASNEAGTLVRMRTRMTTTAATGQTNYMRLRYGCEGYSDMGLSEYIFEPGATNAPVNGVEQTVSLWHVVQSTADFGPLDRASYHFDMIHQPGQAMHSMKIRGLTVDEYRTDNKTPTMFYNRGGSVLGTMSVVAPTSGLQGFGIPFGVAQPGGWSIAADSVSGGIGSATVIDTASWFSVEFQHQSAAVKHFFSLRSNDNFQLATGKVYVTDVYIRSDADAVHPPYLRVRWNKASGANNPIVANFDMDVDSTGVTIPGTSTQKGPNEGGAPAGGESRIYSSAFEPQFGTPGTLTSYKLYLDLWDDLTTRDTSGTYIIERVVVREYTF
ncbi:S8 family serine peptidase [Candidatus Poribacteria bacterium]|nr:S8 family serine peptidase [Candidatus Poribacteria bacterium]